MGRLLCTKCNYRFEKDKVPNRCPYCSREGTLQREKSAQQLLDEVDFSED